MSSVVGYIWRYHPASAADLHRWHKAWFRRLAYAEWLQFHDEEIL